VVDEWLPSFLKDLPQPPDQPASLFQEAPPIGAPPPNLERPYFQVDPILDPPQWGHPGWFFNVQFDVIHPVVHRRLIPGAMDSNVTTPSGKVVTVALPGPKLRWTVAPRFEVGYRLASGFGGFALADRFFSTDGVSHLLGPNGPGTETGHLGTNYTDLDYFSREYTPWQQWGMMWRLGTRLAYANTQSQFFEPFAAAAAGNGVRATLQNTSSRGIGPHFGVALDRRIGQSGFSFVGKVDAAWVFSQERQTFGAATTAMNPSGGRDFGVLRHNFYQMISILNFQVGLGYQPPQLPNIRLFAGYIFEAWYNTEQDSNANGGLGASRAMFTNQGVALQLGINF
jgi:hypothetical protein